MKIKQQLADGYSLIELMVVVAIIGIISAIAYPSYQGYTCDTFRGQAVADLKICSLAIERYYSDGFTYAGALVDDSSDSLCSSVSPSEGEQAKYDITLTSATLNNFVIQAAPATGQACGTGTTITLSADGTVTEI